MKERATEDGRISILESSAIYEIIYPCMIIRLIKELDHHTAIEIKATADRLIDQRRIKYIVFDFSIANFMDSAGIGVIMGRYKKIVSLGGKVMVTNVNPIIDRILKISGLYKIVNSYSSITDAINAVK